MGFSRVVYLYCDGQSDVCECAGQEASSGDSPAETIALYKAVAKANGWHFRGRLAYCSPCWQELRKRRNENDI